MVQPVKGRKRTYSSPQRDAQASRTRAAVLKAARRLFISRGYAAVGVSEIAKAANVNVDTVYSAVGRKPALMLAVIDQTLGSSEEVLQAEQRDYVRAVRMAPTATAKLRTYAEALGRLMPRVAPLFAALRESALTDPECAALYTDVANRRAANMRLLAADLRATGELRADLSDDQVAELIWSTNAPEWFSLVTSRGWTTEHYVNTLTDMWCRTLLARPERMD